MSSADHHPFGPAGPNASASEFAAKYLGEQAEAERGEEAQRAEFEERVAGPARLLRPEWDAAWSDLADRLGPVWTAIREQHLDPPLPAATGLTPALKRVGEALLLLDAIRVSRVETTRPCTTTP